MLTVIKKLQNVDKKLTNEFYDHVEQIENFDKGKNKGITQSLYRLKFEVMELQYITLIKKVRHGTAAGEVNEDFKYFMDLITEKTQVLKEMMLTTMLPEEANINVPRGNNVRLEDIHYLRNIPVAQKGAHPSDTNKYTSIMNTIYDELDIEEQIETQLNIEHLYSQLNEMFENEFSLFGAVKDTLFKAIVPKIKSENFFNKSNQKFQIL